MQRVTPEELYLYCKADSEEQQLLVLQLAEVAEASLVDKNIVINDRSRPMIGLAVKAMTLHELDHPGEEFPRGIREKINDLKFNHKGGL
jgi:hypothetical protein